MRKRLWIQSIALLPVNLFGKELLQYSVQVCGKQGAQMTLVVHAGLWPFGVR